MYVISDQIKNQEPNNKLQVNKLVKTEVLEI